MVNESKTSFCPSESKHLSGTQTKPDCGLHIGDSEQNGKIPSPHKKNIPSPFTVVKTEAQSFWKFPVSHQPFRLSPQGEMTSCGNTLLSTKSSIWLSKQNAAISSEAKHSFYDVYLY